MQDEIKRRLEQAVMDKVFPGCVFGVWTKDTGQIVVSSGGFTYEEDSRRVQKDTIFDVASVTKVVPTSLLLLRLMDSGDIKLTDRVVDYIPEFFSHENKKYVLVKHLLTYTLNLDIPAISSMKDLSAEDIIKTILMAPLKNDPGSAFLYTNSTTMIMGLLINKITGKNLDKLAREVFFEPLGMNRTTFRPEEFGIENIPPTEIDDWRGGVVQGIVHDEGTYSLQPKYYLGVAGLFSTVPDLLEILKIIVNKGIYGNKRYFSENLIKEMNTNYVKDLGDKTGLGWQMKKPEWPYFGNLSPQNTIGQNGFTGCFILCDLENGIAVAMLSNRTYPKRPVNGDAINAVRSDLVDIVYRMFRK